MSRAGELRKDSWVEVADVLFIDNPVGTGFSYVLNGSNFTHNNDDIAADLLTFLSRFVQDHPERQSTPLYIFSESYGMTCALSSNLDSCCASSLSKKLLLASIYF